MNTIHRMVTLRPNDEPEGVHRVAEKRSGLLLRHWGTCVDHLSIQSLAASCYLQGAEDAITAMLNEQPKSSPQLTKNIPWENMQ